MPSTSPLTLQIRAISYKTRRQLIRSYYMNIIEIFFPYCIFLMLANVIKQPVKSNTHETVSEDVLSGSRIWHPIVYFPNDSVIATMLKLGADPEKHPTLLPFATLEEATDFLHQVPLYRHLVHFQNYTFADDIQHLNYTVVLDLEQPMGDLFSDSYKDAVDYLTTVQLAVAQMYIRFLNRRMGLDFQSDIRILTIDLLPKTTEYHGGDLLALRLLLPFLFMWLAVFTSKWMVDDGLLKYKYSMTLIGLSSTVYVMNWLIVRCFMGTFPTCIAAFQLTHNRANGPIFDYDPILIFIWLMITNVNTVSLGFAMSVVFQRAWFPTTMAVLTYLTMCFVATFINLVRSPLLSNLFGVFIYYTGVGVCLEAMIEKKYGREEETTQKIPDNPDDFIYHFSFLHGITMMILNTIFNALLTGYLVVILPEDQGKQKSIFHLFQFWFKRKNPVLPEPHTQHPKCIQKSTPTETELINVRNLMKVYDNDVVLRGINLNIIKDQTTAIVGVLGSGKSTLLSILLGLTPASFGAVYIDGVDITKDLSRIRYGNFATCPQENIFFPKLTCLEHLTFFYQLQHEYTSYIVAELQHLLQHVGLEGREHLYPTKLNLGQKRKLSIASAFAVDKKIIFIDEPTCGIDHKARRDIWRFLKTAQSGKTIIVATNSMTEAGRLGDRIAVMKHGVIQSCGTTTFLDTLYGTGYTLTLVKGPMFNEELIYNIVKHWLEEACLKEVTLTKMKFHLPVKNCGQFPRLMAALQEILDNLIIDSKEISAFTFEEILQRVNEGMLPSSSVPNPKPLPEYATSQLNIKFSVNDVANDCKRRISPSLSKSLDTYIKSFLTAEPEKAPREPRESLDFNESSLKSEQEFNPSTLNRKSDTEFNPSSTIPKSDTELRHLSVHWKLDTDFNESSINRNTETELNQSSVKRKLDADFKKSSLNRKSETYSKQYPVNRKLDTESNQSSLNRKSETYSKQYSVNRNSDTDFNQSSLKRKSDTDFNQSSMSNRSETDFNQSSLLKKSLRSASEYKADDFSLVANTRKSFFSQAYASELLHLDRAFSETLIDKTEFDFHMLNGEKHEGIHLFFQQMKAIFIKKWIIFKRNILLTYRIITFHIALICVGLVVVLLTTPEQEALTELNFENVRAKATIVLRRPTLKTEPIFSYFVSCLPERFDRILVGQRENFTDVLNAWMEVKQDKDKPHLVLGVELRAPPEYSRLYSASCHTFSRAIALQCLLNAHMQLYFGSDHTITTYVRTFVSHERGTHYHIDLQFPVALRNMYLSAWTISIAVWVVESFFLSKVVYECCLGFKHLQYISGIHACRYWLTHFLFDFLLCLLIVMVQSACALIHPAMHGPSIVHLAVVLVMFMFSILPYLYTLQGVFKGPEVALLQYILLNVIVAVVDEVGIISYREGSWKKYLLGLIFPNLPLHRTFLELFDLRHFHQDVDCQLFDLCQNTNLLFLPNALCYWLILLAIELQLLKRLWYSACCCCSDMYVCFNEHHRINHARYKRNYESDNDVTAVSMRIINDSLTILFANDEIIVYNICKKYRIRDRALVAVENTSLGLKKNDFFGLLGNTGCGKSTLLNMMVGKIMMTYGDVYYNGHSIKTDFFKVAKHIGYCSQDDYLINELTGRETLLLFGRIRGVPEQRLQRIVEYLADVTLLTSIVDVRVQNYNIINRRKLSFAIAIIGNPPYILMDEPTKGVEPIVKLAMWSLLRHHQKSGCTIILASESCRECTTLCTTMAVMVDSRIVCLGTPEQLSRKYGNSYTISLHLKDGLDTTKHIVKHIHTVFKRVPVYETDMYVHFELPQNLMPLSKLFTLTETMKVELDLDSYTIRHTSLELKYLFYMWKEEDQ